MSCEKEEITETDSTSTTTTTTTTKTEVRMTVSDAQNNPKSGYTVMMFLEQPTASSNLPNIEMQVDSDSEGIATFDLGTYITSPTLLYFEAFKKVGNDYEWKSITHPSKSIKKGTKWTTSIIVE